MKNNIVYLNPESQLQTSAKSESPPVMQAGRQYLLPAETLPDDLQGLCGGFICTAEHGCTLPLQTNGTAMTAYVWDADSLPHVCTNRFTISHTTLDKPQITEQNGIHQISTVAGFDYVYTADQVSARLGVIHLVESHCFAILKNGEQRILRDSGEEQSMLHRHDLQDDVVTPVLDADQHAATIARTFKQTIAHTIPEHIDGLEVDTMTILEQYTSYFMHRETPFSDTNIWIPVCPPVDWGWSIRIARRYDNDLGIARRKLFMPTVEHDGLEMPGW